MHIVLTGGGTAGHVVPNLAIADAIAELNPEVKISYIGSNSGMERRLVERHALPFKGITSAKLRRYFSLQNFIDFFKLPISLFQAMVLLRKMQADVLFSKGGFVALPLVLAAYLNKVPIIIHESDAILGLTTRISAPFATKILLAYQSVEAELKSYKDKVEVCGSPIREEIIKGDKELGMQITGFSGERPVLLVMGGSSGSAQINQIIKEEKEKLMETFDVIHITGARHAKDSKEEHYWSCGFVYEEIAHLYAIATHALSRAGANTLAELEALKIPCLLYPLGLESSRGDQIENAKYMACKYNFMQVADEEKSALSQLILLPKRNDHVKESYVAKHIAQILLGVNE